VKDSIRNMKKQKGTFTTVRSTFDWMRFMFDGLADPHISSPKVQIGFIIVV
jgi:hypothetical protein